MAERTNPESRDRSAEPDRQALERDRADTRERGFSENEGSERDQDRIASRAYERFESRGGEHGHDQEDWFEAEREVKGRRDQR
jgi:hypothetical protein